MGKRLGSISVGEWGTITIRAIAEALEYQGDGSFHGHNDLVYLLSY
ncbi:hypothetical protein JYG34_14410 [Pseudomonas entomophila]|nr:hypothetical protein [Pseudomonas entomophila]QVM89226.1 hypothetical protein JYG34_14410 [Pseudomonas entomophila]